jgi:hypothetical protein
VEQEYRAEAEAEGKQLPQVIQQLVALVDKD